MSIDNNEKMLENVRTFAFSRFGSLKGLADAMCIKPQNLNTYLQGKVNVGPKFIQRLKDVGFSDNIDGSMLQNVISDNEIKIDLEGALELSNTPAARLAQLMGVPAATLDAFATGKESPTMEQLTNLFNLVVALGLSARTAQQQSAKAPPEEMEPSKNIG